jgi:hypothetical protein
MRIGALLVSAAVCFAQAPSSLSKAIAGEVASIDAATKQLKIKGDDGVSYTLAPEEAASFLRLPLGEKDLKKADKIAFTDVAVGDRLLARGPVTDASKPVPVKTIVIMTKADLAKKHEGDRAEWQKRGITGSVTGLNPDAKEITIDTHARGGSPVVIEASAAQIRHYSDQSVNFADARPSSFAELHNGDVVQALGDKSEDGTHFKAQELIAGSFQTIAATVISVDAASGEIKITDLATKKPVTVRTNSNSLMRHLEERTATMLARRMRPDLAGAAPTGGAPAGAPAAGQPPQGGRGFGGPGGGGRGPAGGDLRQILDRSPALALADLKKGDALIVSSSKAADGSAITAFYLIAGVEPFLAAAPRTAGQVDLGSWNLSVGAAPEN